MKIIPITLCLATCFHSLFSDDAPLRDASSNLTQTLLMLGVAFMFFYFILWRPEKKKQKALEKKRSEIKNGDGIVTIGGIMGRVHSIKETSIIVDLYSNGKMEVLKSAISDIMSEDNK